MNSIIENSKQCSLCRETKMRHFYHSNQWRLKNCICMGCKEKDNGVKKRFYHNPAWRQPIHPESVPDWDYSGSNK